MRLWHKDLLPYLPRLQLLSQYRECCCIAKSIHDKGTPNHILVNKIMDYPIEHFYTYTSEVYDEFKRRGYNCRFINFIKWLPRLNDNTLPTHNELFKDWHNERYLKQCLFNLDEKHLCGGIPNDEWDRIKKRFEMELK